MAEPSNVPRMKLLISAWSVLRMANFATAVAIATLAFELGGATWVSAVLVGRWLPGFASAPFAADLADRLSRRRVLQGSALARAVLLGGLAGLVAIEAHPLLLLGAVAADSVVATAYRPAHSAMLPTLARTPGELSAANVTTGSSDFLAFAVGTLSAGATAALAGFPTVFAGAALAMFVAAVLVGQLPDVRRARPRGSRGALGTRADGLRSVLSDQRLRTIMAVHLGLRVTQGMLDVLLVVIALDLLQTGRSGVGLLNGLWGLGGFLVGLAIHRVGTGTTGRSLTIGLITASLPIAVLGLLPAARTTWLLLVLGGGFVIVELAVVTVTQRLTPEELLGRVFGIHEALSFLGNAIGAVVVPLLLATTSARTTLVVVGVLLPALTLLGGRRIRALGASVTAPPERYALLRSLPMFSSLPVGVVETMALKATSRAADPGDVVMRVGDRGDAIYLVEDGLLDVVDAADTPLRRLGTGDVAGEIALLRGTARTATIIAVERSRLLRLDRSDFLAAVDGHARSRGLADDLADDRLADDLHRHDPDRGT